MNSRKRQKFDTWFYTRVKGVGQPLVKHILNMTKEDFETMAFNSGGVEVVNSLREDGHASLGRTIVRGFTLRHKVSKRVITVHAARLQDLFKYAEDYEVVKSDDDFFKDY